jgi:small conductance mechanosensitive channel
VTAPARRREKAMSESLQRIEQVQATLIDLALRFGPRLFTALMILIVGFFAGRAIARAAEQGLRHIEMEPPVRLLLVRIVRLLVVVLFVIIALQNLGVELLPLIAGLGIVGAGIALAMQGLLGNIVAGLSIIFTKPFRVGEYISIVGEEGRVETITLFNTTLSHPDRSIVVIPNRKIVGEILHNYGRIRQLDITVGVAYDTDLSLAVQLIDEVLRANGSVLTEPAPMVGAVLLGRSSVSIAVRPWVDVQNFGRVTAELNRALLETFRERGVVIPFPQREVRLLNPAPCAA